jgi:hypothetical protein
MVNLSKENVSTSTINECTNNISDCPKRGCVSFLIPILAGLLAFIISHSIYVAAGVLFTGIILNFLILISIIPIIGFVIQYFTANWVYSHMVVLASIPSDVMWIMNGLYWWNLIIGAIVTIGVTFMLIAVIFADR